MGLVTQGYGAEVNGSILCSTLISRGAGHSTNMNYELYIDGQTMGFFSSVSLNRTISALSSFAINMGNPNNLKTHRLREGASVEFKAGWGNTAPTTQISGFIRSRSLRLGSKRSIVISGYDKGEFLLQKKPWDKNKNPVEYYNERASAILEDLVGFVPELSLQLTRRSAEPRLDWVTDPKSNNMKDEIKAVAEYAGYEWQIIGSKIHMMEKLDLTSDNARYNVIVGSRTDYETLPDLPYVALLGSDIDEDGTAIRNAYKVEGKDGISSYAENPVSIQTYGRWEGFYSDSRLTSTQSCRVVAKQLANINGSPRTTINVSHRGTQTLNVGEVVRVGDYKGMFDVLGNPYLEVVSMNHVFGQTWKVACQLGTLERSLNEVI